jgi:hypothetical protein
MKNIALILTLSISSLFAQIKDQNALENLIQVEIEKHGLLHDNKCGLRTQLILHDHKDQIDKGLLKNYLAETTAEPVREKSRLTPSGNFVLHYDETGVHAVSLVDLDNNGYPDYIDSAAAIFDSVWRIEVDQMGYLPPPDQNGNPAVPYPIYISSMIDVHYPQQYYGETVPSFVDIPSLPGVNYTSYILVDNDYEGYDTEGLDGLRVTAAHEFHHAIQLGYNVRWEDAYFYEMTSTWMEEVVYPDINDYLNYLDDFFYSVSNESFDNYSGYFPYANSLYLQMLEAKYEREVVKKIWDNMKSEEPIKAISDVLETYNGSWSSSLGEYGLWLYYTGERAISDQFFYDAPYFPQVRIQPVDQFTFVDQFNENLVTARTANRFLLFSDLVTYNLNFRVETNTASKGGFRHLTPTNYSTYYPLNTQIANQQIDNDNLVVVLTNAESENIDLLLNIMKGENQDLSAIYAYPNPVTTQTGNVIKFQNIPSDADLFIFNMLGERIAVVETSDNSTLRSWPLVNLQGETVVSGIYMYVVKGDGISKTGKFSIIR